MISLIMIMIMIISIMIRDSGDDDNYHLDLYIIGRFCLFVTKNDHFAQDHHLIMSISMQRQSYFHRGFIISERAIL